MREQKALEHYKGAKKYNCAQAIMKAFQDFGDYDDTFIEQYQAFGGGRADGGLCGALYAAKVIAESAGKADKVEKRFGKEAGSTICRTLRKEGHVSCRDCVALAARILGQELLKGEYA